jgi:L-lactate dehydrogenase
MAGVSGSDDIEVCRDADVLVLTVGGLPKPGQTRLDLAGESVAICRELLPPLLEVAPDAVVLIITNPVDVVTYAAIQILGLPANRVIGSGTVLDSSRLRYLIAEHCGVAVQSVHAYVVGEHGDSEMPLWSSATIGAVPILEWSADLTPERREGIVHQVVRAGYEIMEGKGYTNYAVALAACRIVEAVLNDEHQVLSVSSLLTEDGIGDVCLSVPSIIDRSGVARVLPVRMSADEREGFRRSAQTVRAALDQLGF